MNKRLSLILFFVHFSLLITHSKVGLPGLEPGTSPLSEERSNQLSYKPLFQFTMKNLVNEQMALADRDAFVHCSLLIVNCFVNS